MAWFILARLLFTGAVVYSAFLLRPLGPELAGNLLFGVGLAALAVVFEWQLGDTPVTHMLGALVGGALGLALAKGIGAALFWADPGDQRVAFLHSFVLLVLPVPRSRDRRPEGGVARADAADEPVPGRRPRAPLQDPRHVGHHRRPYRRPVRHRLHRRHAGHPAVRAQGAAAGGRLGRFDEAEPRAPRARHPAEDPEDVGRRGHRVGRRLSRGPGSGPQAHRAGAHALGQDRHQRLQPEQGRPAARRGTC